ncbi:hypothetical protein U1Q18_005684 [Sarracenia purpurea var. burkii]
MNRRFHYVLLGCNSKASIHQTRQQFSSRTIGRQGKAKQQQQAHWGAIHKAAAEPLDGRARQNSSSKPIGVQFTRQGSNRRIGQRCLMHPNHWKWDKDWCLSLSALQLGCNSQGNSRTIGRQGGNLTSFPRDSHFLFQQSWVRTY